MVQVVAGLGTSHFGAPAARANPVLFCGARGPGDGREATDVYRGGQQPLHDVDLRDAVLADMRRIGQIIRDHMGG